MVPELLTATTVEEATRYIADERFWVQRKCDGVRLIVKRQGKRIEGWNKKGQPTTVDPKLAFRLLSLEIDEFVLDGEWERPDSYCCWDLLQFHEMDLRHLKYTARHRALVWYFMATGIAILPSAITMDEKEEMITVLQGQKAEGIVIKDSEAIYKPGRANQHYKLKFEKSLTARVRGVDPVRNRVSVEMLEGKTWREVCGLKVQRGSLHAGAFIEVRYLYGTPDRRLVQPVFLSVREDVSEEDCSMDQIVPGHKWQSASSIGKRGRI